MRLWFGFWTIFTAALCAVDAAGSHWVWAILAAFNCGASFCAFFVEMVDPS